MASACAHLCRAALWTAFIVASALALPDIVIFVPDEMHAGSMGTYGHPVTRTPNFDAFAKDGSLFLHAHTTHTVCTPSRCSFMTGRYVHQGGHRTLWDPLRIYEGNLLRSLKSIGYHVIWFGKNDLLDDADGSFNASVSQVGQSGDGDSGGLKYNLSDPRYYSFVANPPSVDLNATSDMSNTLDALNAINIHVAARERGETAAPFVIYLPLTAPHPPYGCAEPFYSMYFNSTLPPLRPYGLPGKPDYHDLIRLYRNLSVAGDAVLTEVQALYLGCISYSDAVFGVLRDGLQSAGLYNATAMFVLADHGDYSGNYGLVEKWPSGLEDVLTHVPLMMKVPGGVPGQVLTGLVQHMDLTPTVLDMVNVTANWTMAAVSHYSKLMGRQGDDLTRLVFAEGGYATNEPNSFEGRCDDPLQPGQCDPSNIYYPKGYQEWHIKLSVCRSSMVVSPGGYKLVRRSDPQDADHYSELYDLNADPTELNNVYNNPAYAAVQANLSMAMLNWYVQTSDVTPFDEQSRATPKGNFTTAVLNWKPVHMRDTRRRA